MARTQPVPAQALAWLLEDAARVLVVGPVPGLIPMIPADVIAIDSSPKALSRCTETHARLILARPESLPFEPEHFDVVLFVDNLTQFDRRRSFAQIARVLRPGGRIGVVQTSRDDSVPWVRRLAKLIQTVDPHAMTGNGVADIGEILSGSRYFPVVETTHHRTFFPVSKDGMVRMVEHRPAVAHADERSRQQLLADVGALYDSMSRPPEPLNLPYLSRCWRAQVCQDEMSIPIEFEDGLRLFGGDDSR